MSTIFIFVTEQEIVFSKTQCMESIALMHKEKLFSKKWMYLRTDILGNLVIEYCGSFHDDLILESFEELPESPTFGDRLTCQEVLIKGLRDYADEEAEELLSLLLNPEGETNENN